MTEEVIQIFNDMIALAQKGIIAASGGVAYDVNAKAYFDAIEAAGGSLTLSEKAAWNAYINTLKINGTWSKRKLILGLSGGTAGANAIDVITATNKVTWHGTITHNKSGAKGDGSSGYGDVAFNPSTGLSNNKGGFGAYIRTEEQDAGWMGVTANSGAGAFFFVNRANAAGGNSLSSARIGDWNAGVAATLNPDPGPWNGYLCGMKFNNTSLKLYRNGAVLASTSASNTGNLINGNVNILGLNITDGSRGFTAEQLCMFQIWDDTMTEADILQDNIDVEALQDGLSRGVQ